MKDLIIKLIADYTKQIEYLRQIQSDFVSYELYQRIMAQTEADTLQKVITQLKNIANP